MFTGIILRAEWGRRLFHCRQIILYGKLNHPTFPEIVDKLRIFCVATHILLESSEAYIHEKTFIKFR